MQVEITDEYLYNILPKVAELEIRELEEEKLEFIPSRKFQQKMKRLVRKSKYPKIYRFIEQKAVRAASWIIAVLGLCAVTAFTVKATEELRLKIKEQIFYDGYVVESYEVSGEGQIKYLTQIPEDYKLIEEQWNDHDYWAQYENSEGEIFSYSVWFIDASTSISKDTDFARVETVTIDDMTISIGYKENLGTRTYWYENNLLYILDATALDKEQIVNMIESRGMDK